MESYQRNIVISGDVGTYKAAFGKKLKQFIDITRIPCFIIMKDKAVEKAFNVFITTSKSEFHSERHKSVLDEYDLILDIDTMTEEEAVIFAIERFVFWAE